MKAFVDRILVQRRSVPVREEGRSLALREGSVCTENGIRSQHLDKLRSDRNDAAFVELAVANAQFRGRQIDIGHREPPCLSASQAGSVKDQKQRAEGLCIQLNRILPAGIYGAEDAAKFVVRVDVGRRRPRRSRLVVRQRRRNRGALGSSSGSGEELV